MAVHCYVSCAHVLALALACSANGCKLLGDPYNRDSPLSLYQQAQLMPPIPFQRHYSRNLFGYNIQWSKEVAIRSSLMVMRSTAVVCRSFGCIMNHQMMLRAVWRHLCIVTAKNAAAPQQCLWRRHHDFEHTTLARKEAANATAGSQ